MAGQPDVHQAGDHHRDAEHPSGGQERKGQKVARHPRGDETRGSAQAGGRAEHVSTGRDGPEPKKHDDCDVNELIR